MYVVWGVLNTVCCLVVVRIRDLTCLFTWIIFLSGWIFLALCDCCLFLFLVTLVNRVDLMLDLVVWGLVFWVRFGYLVYCKLDWGCLAPRGGLVCLWWVLI